MSNSRPLIVVMAGLLVFHLRVGRPEVAGTLVGFSVVAMLSAGDIQATGYRGSTVLGSGLALGGRVLGGVHGDRAPSGWRRSAGHDCAFFLMRRRPPRPTRFPYTTLFW